VSDFAVRRLAGEADWEAAREIRRRVFIEEQGCPPEEEWDEHDAPPARGTTCIHLLGLAGDEPVATARWRVIDHAGAPAAKLERFAVLRGHRGRGLGRRIVAAAMDDARAAGHDRFVLHAQSYLVEFYADFGFTPAGRPFDEAGIEHVRMVLAAG
jgi:predicted GNAT family N-acyltransferase